MLRPVVMKRTTMRKGAFAAGIVGIVLLATTNNGCGAYATGTGSPLAGAVGNAACPELRAGAMSANFDEDARANATIRAFVTASGDLAETAARVQADVFMACERMADDLGIADPARRPKNEEESKVAASCNAVAARIDAIMKQGVSANMRADVTPPQCQVNASAEAACRGQCNAQGSASGNAQGQAQNNQASGSARGAATADARCEGSCKAHADLTAQCTEPRVNVQAQVDTGEIGKVVATLQRNLPPLIKAQVAYGQRIAGDVDVLVRTGAELPRAFGHLTAKAGACVAAAANATLSAQASLRVSVQASASVSAKAGASSSASM
jgi:hypothetical protein